MRAPDVKILGKNKYIPETTNICEIIITCWTLLALLST